MHLLTEILKAKEYRQFLRKEFAEQGYANISLNFNIPGYPKSNDIYKKAFFIVKEELSYYLIASRIAVITDKIKIQHDEAGDICFFPIVESKYDLKSIKEDLEAFEKKHPLGRLLDIDLFDLTQNPISSGKKKNCFICKDKSAIECMREQRHSYEELHSHTIELVKKYLHKERQKNLSLKLTSFALQAILMEVSLPGKPGLVCPEDSGSHTDMTYLTFIHSSSAISTFFNKIVKLGFAWDGIYNKNILVEIRTLGIQMENAMLMATKGVNTQKGIVFLMGFSIFAAAYALNKKGVFDSVLFRNSLKLLNKGIVGKELENGWNKNTSHGERCFYKFGSTYAGGIRLEIEQGLPTIFKTSLPLMQKYFPIRFNLNEQNDTQEKLLDVLIAIIAVNNDTNILYRTDTETLNKLKAIALCTSTGKGKLSENKFYADLMAFCKAKNISPGGSADLLAVTIFLHQLKLEFKQKKQSYVS